MLFSTAFSEAKIPEIAILSGVTSHGSFFYLEPKSRAFLISRKIHLEEIKVGLEQAKTLIVFIYPLSVFS